VTARLLVTVRCQAHAARLLALQTYGMAEPRPDVRSPDGLWQWDGTAWRPTYPAAATVRFDGNSPPRWRRWTVAAGGWAVVLGVASGAVAAATVYGDPGPVTRDDGTWHTKIPSPPLWATVLAHIAVALIALGTALLLAAVGHAMYAWIGARKKVKT
jgi:hypothetical protein